ncbi:MAG: hypothetical protein KIS67_00420 [Verrucomicrobiae bacterium]|nr:hypothetical protein [Verrucomicrobiae bacterium]
MGAIPEVIHNDGIDWFNGNNIVGLVWLVFAAQFGCDFDPASRRLD